MPEQAFEIVLNVASLGIVASWGTIVLCQLRLHSWWRRGVLERPAFRMPGAPWTGWATVVFLVAVLVLTGFDYPIGTYTIASLVLIGPALVIGWFLCRDRVRAAALERGEITGNHPVVAPRPTRD